MLARLAATDDSLPVAAAASAFLHLFFILAGVIVLPHFRDNLPPMPSPMIVDIVKVSDITNLPPMPKKQAEKTPVTKAVEEPPKPLPEKEVAVKKEAVKETKKEAVAPLQKKEEKPKAELNLEKKKKEDPIDFASVLKTVEKMQQKQTATPEPVVNETKSSAEGQPYIASLPLSISEMDAVRRQIEQCWNVPAGARDAQDLEVHVWVSLNPDGSLIQEKLVDDMGQGNNPFYRSAAESALRALLNPKCMPLKLPPDKYYQWKTMTLNFNPKDMIAP
jgi:outer membrane biosynthesis protein TonB